MKRAWLLGCAWLATTPGANARTIPDYGGWTKRRLWSHVEDLNSDFAQVVKNILAKSDKRTRQRLSRQMSEWFDVWHSQGHGLLTLSTAHEFERRFGPLLVRKKIEVPPYAEMLMQGWAGLAIRHPEYMLARDLAFLWGLFQQAEKELNNVSWLRPPDWARGGSENAQGLARATILTCFSLLEAFISGLARAHVMMNIGLEDEQRARLLNNSRPLRGRVLNVPRWISGTDCGVGQYKPPFSVLFGPIKQRRDAFVHCEPGPQTSKHGYVKEAAFHDVSITVVREAVTATEELIRQIWEGVHRTSGPRWLPGMDDPDVSGPGFSLVPGPVDE